MANATTPASAPAASPAPIRNDIPTDAESDAQLLEILNGGAATPAPKPAKRPPPPAEDAADDEPEPNDDPENEDLDDQPETAAAAAALAGAGDFDDETPEEVPAPEEDADQAAGEDDDADEETRAGFTPEQQRRFDKAMQKKARRIAELKASTGALEARVKEYEQALEQARTNPVAKTTPTADDPLADVEDERTLDTRLEEKKNLHRWALRHLNGAIVTDDKGNKTEVSAERVGEILAETEDFIRDHVPARRQYLRERARFERDAVTAFPWMQDKNSQGYLRIEATLRELGDKRLRDIPFIKIALGDMLLGQQLRVRETKPNSGKPVVGKTAPKAPAAPGGAARPAKISGKVKASSQAVRRLADTGADPGNAALRAIIG